MTEGQCKNSAGSPAIPWQGKGYGSEALLRKVVCAQSDAGTELGCREIHLNISVWLCSNYTSLRARRAWYL